MNLQATEFERYIIYDPDRDLYLSQNYSRWVDDLSKAGKWVKKPTPGMIKDSMRWKGMPRPKNLELVKIMFGSKPLDYERI